MEQSSEKMEQLSEKMELMTHLFFSNSFAGLIHRVVNLSSLVSNVDPFN